METKTEEKPKTEERPKTEEKPKSGFRLLNPLVRPVAATPPPSRPVEGCPIPQGLSSPGKQAAVGACPANVAMDKKGNIMVDLDARAEGCVGIKDQILNSRPGNRKYGLAHFRKGGERLDKDSRAK
jgi:hypothetical protein